MSQMSEDLHPKRHRKKKLGISKGEDHDCAIYSPLHLAAANGDFAELEKIISSNEYHIDHVGNWNHSTALMLVRIRSNYWVIML